MFSICRLAVTRRIASSVGLGALGVLAFAGTARADASSPDARFKADGNYVDSTGNHPPATPAGNMFFVPGPTGGTDEAFHFGDNPPPEVITTDGGVGTFGVGTFDVSFNILTTQTGVTSDVISKRSSCDFGTFFDIRLDPMGHLVGELDGGTPQNYTVITDGSVNNGRYHSVTFRRTADTLQLVVDGRMTSVPLNNNPDLSQPTPVKFGSGPCVGADGTVGFKGNLDEATFTSTGSAPPPVVPEASSLVLVPVTGGLVGGAFLILRRRRPQPAAA